MRADAYYQSEHRALLTNPDDELRLVFIAFDFLGFQFRARKTMWRKGEQRIFAHSFQPAASPKALKRINRSVRSWALHHRSDKSLTELAAMYNPCIRCWIAYYVTSTRRSCVRPWSGSMPMSFDGHAASSSGCAVGPKEAEIGLTGSVGQIRISSLTRSYAMATAEHREPCESRGSRTVLGAPGGETPPGDSTLADYACLPLRIVNLVPSKT